MPDDFDRVSDLTLLETSRTEMMIRNAAKNAIPRARPQPTHCKYCSGDLPTNPAPETPHCDDTCRRLDEISERQARISGRR